MRLREALQGAADVVFTDGVWQWSGDEMLQALAERAPRVLDHRCDIDTEGIVFERVDGTRVTLRPA